MKLKNNKIIIIWKGKTKALEMKIINDIQDAKIEDGGSGAFYIYLKKLK